MRRFSRNRIHGVSFHVQRTGIARPTRAGSATDRPLEEIRSVAQSAKHGQPPDLTKSDIRRLLEDFGRQELHTLVSDAIDAAVRWKHVAESMERLFALDDDKRIYEADEVGALIEARTTLRLWRHRIDVLELVADAQRSLLTQGRNRKR